MTAWTFTDADREFVARHVEPYLPDRIFDAHAHLFCHAHYPPGKLPAHLSDTPGEIGLQVYRDHIDWLHPGGRTVGGLFFGLAFQGDRSANDEYVAAEVKAGQAAGFKSLGQMLIAPEMDPELVRETAPDTRRSGKTLVAIEAICVLLPVVWLLRTPLQLPPMLAALAGLRKRYRS